jgi:transposase
MPTFIDPETRVPLEHPLRVIKAMTDRILAILSPEFDRMCAELGRPSIPPERLLKSSLLIALYSVRSERAFCEELNYNLLFRWFLGMDLVEPSFDATTFTKNRERLLKHRVGQALFDEVVLEADHRGLLSDEHFTVDGTLIEAAASLESFKRRDGDPPRTTDDDPGNPSVGARQILGTENNVTLRVQNQLGGRIPEGSMSTQSQRALLLSHSLAEFERRVNPLLDTERAVSLGASPPIEPADEDLRGTDRYIHLALGRAEPSTGGPWGRPGGLSGEPPMPAKTTLDQASKLAQSLVWGQPNRERIALTDLSDKGRELV